MNKAKVLGFATLILLTVTALAFVDYSLQQQTDFLVGHGVYFPGYWYTQIASVNLRNTPDNMTWQVGDITIHYSYSLYFATVGPQLPLPASFVECEYGHSTNAYPCNQIVILIATSSVDNCPYPACPSLPNWVAMNNPYPLNLPLNLTLPYYPPFPMSWHLYIYLASKT